jgi:hypothetical protein
VVHWGENEGIEAKLKETEPTALPRPALLLLLPLPLLPGTAARTSLTT